MTIRDFNWLSEYEQGYIILHESQFIESRFDNNYKYDLYAVYMFWVEDTYDKSHNQIICMKSFVANETLDKYSNVPKVF